MKDNLKVFEEMEDKIGLSVQKSGPYKDEFFFNCLKTSFMTVARGGIAHCYIGSYIDIAM